MDDIGHSKNSYEIKKKDRLGQKKEKIKILEAKIS